jgi:hypothetical protein
MGVRIKFVEMRLSVLTSFETKLNAKPLTSNTILQQTLSSATALATATIGILETILTHD